MAAAIKCKHCGSMITGSVHPVPAQQPIADPRTYLVEILKEHHASFAVKKGWLEDGKMDIWSLDQIPAKELEDARKSYAPYNINDEKPFLLVNKKSFGMNFTGLLITDKTVWYAVVKKGFLASLRLSAQKGYTPLCSIKTIALEDPDTALGAAYVGHEFAINGDVIGFLRMGNGLGPNENMLNYIRSLFARLTQSGLLPIIK